MSPKLEAFYDAVADQSTLDEFVEGVDITFQYRRKTYRVNTKPPFRPKIRPVHKYYEWLDKIVEEAKPI